MSKLFHYNFYPFLLTYSRRFYCSAKTLNRKKFSFKNKFRYSEFFDKHKSKVPQEAEGTEKGNFVSADLLSMKSLLQAPETSFEGRLNIKGEILFGLYPVHLALLNQKRQFYQLFIRRGLGGNQPQNLALKENIVKLAISLGVRITNVNSQNINSLAPGVVHQGVCLDASSLPLPEYVEAVNVSNEGKLGQDVPLWLVLDQILDPMNVGAIIRSAYYFGVERLFTVKGHSCRLSPIVSKASSGALEVVNIAQLQSLEDFILAKKKCGWLVISTASNAAFQNEKHTICDISDFQISKPSILILGSEGKGISPNVMELCDSIISIFPKRSLPTEIDSLNVSVAAGVILHSLKRQT